MSNFQMQGGAMTPSTPPLLTIMVVSIA